MEDIIHLLPDNVANQIAAGEVVQRPASIIKEMVENSIDAGAKNIQVLVVDGGKTNVQVIDDGKGMSETDARMSFERHATSKIINASDLFALTTMGFRGEALASIAAVAQVDLKTRRKEDELGTHIHIAGGKMECQEPVVCPVGSNFSVQNLFFNVPARRKFMKSNQTELTNVVQDFERIVLVHPDISFSLKNNEVEMFHLPVTTVRQRIVDVFGKKINADLLPIEVETSIAKISGYVAKPESSKKRGVNKYMFVNGRYMNHPYFHSAIMKAYENLIPVGEYVSYFVYFSVDPSAIDVNVHPTKTEIKFDNEQAIWQVLTATVKETLGKFCNVPMIDFDVEGKPEIPVMGINNVATSQPGPVKVSYNPFAKSSYNKDTSYKRVENWEALYGSPSSINIEDPFMDTNMSNINGVIENGESKNPALPFDDPDLIPSKNFESETSDDQFIDIHLPKFQYQGRYIVLPSSEGIVFVDQYRAHVRVLFEQYMYNMKFSRRASQKVLFPEIIQFTKNEQIVLEDMMDDITALGFDINNIGGGSYSVLGVPAGSEGINADNVLHDIVASALDKTGAPKQEAEEAMALSMAQSAAVVYGQVLSVTEMNQILLDLFKCNSPARTPDGKIIYSIIDNKSVEKLF